VNVGCGGVLICKPLRLKSAIPGITYNTVTLPRSAPVSKRDVCVFSQIPKKVRLKSISSGRTARNKNFRGGIAALRSERTSG